jgi:carbamoyl-phosphate synthase small subunit
MSGKQSVTKPEIMHRNRSNGGDFFVKKGIVSLADGTTFTGEMPEWQSETFTGEVVFNTGMTGYIESLTDPSYTNQILVFTYPLIGNYGVDTKWSESDKIHVAGVVVSEACKEWSHEGSDQSLLEWLRSQHIPILMDVDTRALTKYLRTRGTMLGTIADKEIDGNKMHLEPRIVSVTEPIIFNKGGSKKVILVDCGAKDNILRSLLDLAVEVKKVPYDYDYTAEDYDGVLLSNGPGDPTDYQPTIAIAKKALAANKPVFGICLGTQIMALAAGASTYKLKFGHRGHNQPCLETDTKRGFITSQNHGYAIDADSLPKGWEVTLRNLNDDSVEGIRHTSKPFFSVQFHPEACPGPTDTAFLFERFYKSL